MNLKDKRLLADAMLEADPAFVRTALSTIAAYDAQRVGEDGVGFSNADTEFVTSLLSRPMWTPKQQACALRVSRKYGKQVVRFCEGPWND